MSGEGLHQLIDAEWALDIDGGPVPAEVLLEAAAPLVKEVAASLGFSEVAVFGSVARGQARVESDVDLLVTPPPGATIEDMTRLLDLMEWILGRSVDVVSYGALKGGIDDDILREAVLL